MQAARLRRRSYAGEPPAPRERDLPLRYNALRPRFVHQPDASARTLSLLTNSVAYALGSDAKEGSFPCPVDPSFTYTVTLITACSTAPAGCRSWSRSPRAWA